MIFHVSSNLLAFIVLSLVRETKLNIKPQELIIPSLRKLQIYYCSNGIKQGRKEMRGKKGKKANQISHKISNAKGNFLFVMFSMLARISLIRRSRTVIFQGTGK